MLLLKKFIDYMLYRKTAATFLTAVVSLALLAAIGGCGGGEEEGRGARLRVAADIVPLADFCRQVGGAAVEVEVMVPPGATPHAYELTTGQMRFLEDAEVVVVNGLGLTPWTEEILAEAGNPAALMLEAGNAVSKSRLLYAAGYDDAADVVEGQEVYDPHVWLDPELALEMVAAIRDAFMEADPDSAALYAENAGRYMEELKLLDAEIAEETARFTARKFVALHSSWTYFARRYGLEQVGVIEELPGKEPSMEYLARLVGLMDEQGVGVVFAEPQFSPRVAEAIAEESHGEVTVKFLDPLGDPDNPEWDTYVKMMRKNVEIMEEALR